MGKNKILFLKSSQLANTTFIPPLLDLNFNVQEYDFKSSIEEIGHKRTVEDIINKTLNYLPDYIFYMFREDERLAEVFLKIKEQLPDIEIITWFSDDDWRFGISDRYIALFSDYIITTYKESFEKYKKFGHKNVIFSQWACNHKIFKPLKTKKNYDVTFIGSAYPPRIEWIRYLRDNNINIKVFGKGWGEYKDLADIFGGFLSAKDFVKIVNASKINLAFAWSSKDEKELQFKARVFEFAGCNSFQLTNYNPKLRDYYNEKELIMFSNKDDLLSKIKYYLCNENERENIAQNAYYKTINKNTWEKRFIHIFNKIKNKEIIPQFKPGYNHNPKILVVNTSKQDDKEVRKKLNDSFYKVKLKVLNVSKLKDHVLDDLNIDYVTFVGDGETHYKEKLYYQYYALYRDNSDIALSDYYLNSVIKFWFLSNRSILEKESMTNIVDSIPPSCFMFTSKFFKKYRTEILKKNISNIITKGNTSRIELPLLDIKVNIIRMKKMMKYKKYLRFNLCHETNKLKRKRRWGKYLILQLANKLRRVR